MASLGSPLENSADRRPRVGLRNDSPIGLEDDHSPLSASVTGRQGFAGGLQVIDAITSGTMFSDGFGQIIDPLTPRAGGPQNPGFCEPRGRLSSGVSLAKDKPRAGVVVGSKTLKPFDIIQGTYHPRYPVFDHPFLAKKEGHHRQEKNSGA